jgi:hypothetical protein
MQMDFLDSLPLRKYRLQGLSSTTLPEQINPIRTLRNLPWAVRTHLLNVRVRFESVGACLKWCEIVFAQGAELITTSLFDIGLKLIVYGKCYFVTYVGVRGALGIIEISIMDRCKKYKMSFSPDCCNSSHSSSRTRS